METDLLAWIQIGVGITTVFGILFNIRQVLMASRASLAASDRAAAAAYAAARHAQETALAVASAASDIKRIEVNGNSMMEAARKLALEKAEADANRAYAAGMAEGIAKNEPGT